MQGLDWQSFMSKFNLIKVLSINQNCSLHKILETTWFCYVPISQLLPMYPSSQVHLKKPSWSSQVPCKQGLDLHSSIST